MLMLGRSCVSPSLDELPTEGACMHAAGDMYESTLDILFNLADLLAPGGCIIVDDW